MPDREVASIEELLYVAQNGRTSSASLVSLVIQPGSAYRMLSHVSLVLTYRSDRSETSRRQHQAFRSEA